MKSRISLNHRGLPSYIALSKKTSLVLSKTYDVICDSWSLQYGLIALYIKVTFTENQYLSTVCHTIYYTSYEPQANERRSCYNPSILAIDEGKKHWLILLYVRKQNLTDLFVPVILYLNLETI